MGQNFMDEIDCGNFFDQIDDLIEFPPDTEGENVNLVGTGDCKDFPSMWNEAFPESDPIFSGSHGNDPSDLSAQLSVPYEDIVQLEWLSTFVEESFSGAGMTLGKENACANNNPSRNQFQTSSPVSVLESSSSSSSSSCTGPGKALAISPNHGPQRARTKRTRPTSFNPRAAMHLISPSSSFIETPLQPVTTTPEPESFGESPPVKKTLKRAGPDSSKKKKIKITLPPGPEETPRPDPPAAPVRKCLHCEITKTPQWRAGPMGPKTLCNACGVRYKSGRLFPEYRPAASPTFVPSLHSNSHKKVVEMRTKGEPGPASASLKGSKPLFAPNV